MSRLVELADLAHPWLEEPTWLHLAFLLLSIDREPDATIATTATVDSFTAGATVRRVHLTLTTLSSAPSASAVSGFPPSDFVHDALETAASPQCFTEAILDALSGVDPELKVLKRDHESAKVASGADERACLDFDVARLGPDTTAVAILLILNRGASNRKRKLTNLCMWYVVSVRFSVCVPRM